MLRGWVAVWTMQMLWLFASLTVAVGVVGVLETLVARYHRRREVKIKHADPDERQSRGVASVAQGSGRRESTITSARPASSVGWRFGSRTAANLGSSRAPRS